jgi:hypothetical protein
LGHGGSSSSATAAAWPWQSWTSKWFAETALPALSACHSHRSHLIMDPSASDALVLLTAPDRQQPLRSKTQTRFSLLPAQSSRHCNATAAAAAARATLFTCVTPDIAVLSGVCACSGSM